VIPPRPTLKIVVLAVVAAKRVAVALVNTPFVAKNLVDVALVVDAFTAAKRVTVALVSVALFAKKLEVLAVVAAKRVAVALVKLVRIAKKSDEVAAVPVALVKKILPVVRPPVDEAVRKSRSVVDALTAAKSVAVALVNTVEEASTVPLERTERNDNPVEDATLKRFLVDPEVPPI
jgi:hypothetical protein